MKKIIIGGALLVLASSAALGVVIAKRHRVQLPCRPFPKFQQAPRSRSPFAQRATGRSWFGSGLTRVPLRW